MMYLLHVYRQTAGEHALVEQCREKQAAISDLSQQLFLLRANTRAISEEKNGVSWTFLVE